MQTRWIVMSGERITNCFSSTPLKDFQSSQGLFDGILPDDEDTFSLLSPIYHDSFDSDEDDQRSIPARQTSPGQTDDSRLSVSPIRCELPKAASEHPAPSPALSAWEMWLVSKAKEERLKQEKKAVEERLLKEKKEKQDREREHKKIIKEEKIQEWIKLKREQERHEQLFKQKEEEEMQRQQQRRRETEQKAQQKYKDWLHKKNREKTEKEKREKVEASLKKEEEMERRRKAEEKFKEWLAKTNEKSRASPKNPSCPSSPHDKFYPSPSFINPVPWKPIHIPPPDTSTHKVSRKNPPKQRKSQQSLSSAFRLRNTASPAHLQQRR